MLFNYQTKSTAAFASLVLGVTQSGAGLYALAIGWTAGALVHLLFAWLRAHYHSGHSASDGVLGGIVALCSASPTIVNPSLTIT